MMDSEPRHNVDKRLIVVDTEAEDLVSVGKKKYFVVICDDLVLSVNKHAMANGEKMQFHCCERISKI